MTASTTTDPSTVTLDGRTDVLDTREMVVVHSLFRREIGLAGDLVRRVDSGDTRRIAVVGRHLDLLARTLHHHHVTEDELLWPLLLDRAADATAPIVHTMEAQHGTVAGLLEEISPLRSEWEADGDAATRDHLAVLLDILDRSLTEHLDAEEEYILPLAAEWLTQPEWNALGEAGRSGSARSDRSLVLGMMMYDGDPEVVAGMLASAPRPVRVVVTWLARRAFRHHALTVHGTPTP